MRIQFLSNLLLFIAASGLAMPTATAQWSPVTGLPAGFNPSDVAIAPDGTLFTTGGATDPAQSGLYRSNDGTTWTRRNSGISYGGQEQVPWRIGAFSEVTLASTNGGDGIYRSLNAGDSWTSAGLGPAAAYWDFCRFNADTYFVTKRENVVGQSGVWRSLDRGATWTRTSAGLYGLTLPVVGEVITAEAVTTHHGKLFCAVSTTGLFRSTNGGESWTAVNNNVFVDGTVIGPITNATDVVSTGDRLFASIQNIDAIYMSEDDGDSWTNAGNGLGAFSDRCATDGGTLYAPMHDGRLFVTTDGKSWRYYANTGLPGGVQPFVAVKHGVAAYYTTGSGLYRLDLATAPLVNVAPVITTHPVGGTRLVGSNHTFTVAANGTGPFTYQWQKNGVAISGATSASYTRGPLVADDADLYNCVVTGPGGTAASNQVSLAIVLDTPGNVDTLFDTGVPIANTTSAVNAIQLTSAGRLWTGGSYTSRIVDASAGSTAASRLTTYSGDPLRFNTDGGVTGGAVTCLLPLANGQMLVGGAFTGAGGVANNTKYLARFNADGTFDNTFVAPATTGTGQVNAMVQDPVSGKIYVAGTFLDWGGDSARDRIIRLNADGSLDGTFSSASMVSNAVVNALALAPDGRLYVGGNFFGVTIGASTNFTYQHLARINTDGTVDTTFPTNSTLVPALVVALATLPDGRLYVAANNGNNPQQLQRLLPNATVDPSFALAGNATNIATIAVQPDGKLLVGGNFTTFAGVSTPGKVVRLLNNGAVDASITYQQPGSDSSRQVTGLALSSTRLYVAQFRGGPNGVRRYFNNLVEPSFVVPPQSQSVNAGQPVTLRAHVYATQGVTYQWFKDGVAIPGATADTLSFAALTTGDTASYTVTVTHPFGPITSPAAVVRALAAPQLGVVPTAVAQVGNKPLTIAPDVFGQAPLTYQWLKNGSPIAEGAATGGGGSITGVATRTLSITGLHETDNATYTLRVTNTLGSLDVPIGVTALYQAGYLANDYVAGGASFEGIAEGADDKFYIWHSSVPFSTWAGAAASGNILRLNSDNTRDTTFSAPAFATSGPQGLLRLRSGKLLVWGNFTAVAGQNHPSLARLNSDGTLDPAFIANNRTALPGWSLTGATELPDGKLLVYGTFTNWGTGPGFTGYQTLVCLNADGSVNAEYMTMLGTVPAAGAIATASVMADGRAVVAGSFTSIGGVSRNRIAVLNPDGSVNTTFVPPAFSNGSPNRILPLPDGRLMVSGIFTAIGSFASSFGVLLPTGARDTTVNIVGNGGSFPPVFGFDATGGILIANSAAGNVARFTGNFVQDPDFLPPAQGLSAFNSPMALFGLSSGRIVLRYGSGTFQGRSLLGLAVLRGYAVPLGFISQPQSRTIDLGGNVTLAASATGTTPVSYQWLKDNEEIPGATSASLAITNAARTDSAVYALRITNFTGGTVTSGGATLTVLAEPVFTSVPSGRTVRNGDNVTFAVTAIGVQPITYQWRKNGIDIPGATSATLILSGVALDAAAAYACVASNTVNGTAGQTLSPPVMLSVAGGSGGVLDPAFTLTNLTGTGSPKVECIVRSPGGQLTLGGGFSLSGSYYYAARYNADGTRAASFQTNSGTGASIPSCNGPIYSIARDPQTGNYVAVGGFTLLGGTGRTRIGRFTPDFLADPTFNPGTGFTQSSAFFGDNSAALAIDSASRIYVGGNFTSFNGTTVTRVVRLLADGTLDASFTAPTINAQVNTLLLQGDQLLVGGAFTQVNAVTSPRLIRLNSNGTLDSAFTSPLDSGAVYDLAFTADGDILAAASGSVAGNNYLHRLNADGTRDTAFNTGTTINGIVRALAVAPDGKIFIAGAFGTVNGQPRARVAKLHADGTLDTGWTPGTGFTGGTAVNDLLLGSNGTLYAGGDFTAYNGTSRQFIAAILGDTAPRQVVAVTAPPPAVIGQPLSLSAAATGVAFAAPPYLTYQWVKDGIDIPGATSQTYTIASYSAADSGSYTVRVNDAGGPITSGAVEVATAAGGFSGWADALPAGQRGPNDDPDNDGIANLLEYALDLDPLANSAGLLPPPVGKSGHLTLTYRRARNDVTYVVQTSPTLSGGTWTSTGVNQGTPDGNGITTASIPLGASAGFLRISATLNP